MGGGSWGDTKGWSYRWELTLPGFLWCSFTHTLTSAVPIIVNPSLSFSQVVLLFVLFRGQHQSIWGMGGYSVLKEMLFDKKKKKEKKWSFPFSRKYRGCGATALQSCPENFPWNNSDCLHLKGTSGGFSPWCLSPHFFPLVLAVLNVPLLLLYKRVRLWI